MKLLVESEFQGQGPPKPPEPPEPPEPPGGVLVVLVVPMQPFFWTNLPGPAPGPFAETQGLF